MFMPSLTTASVVVITCACTLCDTRSSVHWLVETHLQEISPYDCWHPNWKRPCAKGLARRS